MDINFIDAAEICDVTFLSFVNNTKEYVRTDKGGIYVPPPSQKIKQAFIVVSMEEIKKRFNPNCHNILVRSCAPADNWRLKHVGKRFNNMIRNDRLVPVAQIDLSNGWQDFFSEWFSKNQARKIELQNCDVQDAISIVGQTRTVVSKLYSNQKCLVDGNFLIAREEGQQIAKLVVSQVNELVLSATML